MAPGAETLAGAPVATFEIVEGATIQLPDGTSVTVRDSQLELDDGRRLPLPAPGEPIIVERTVTRPDGSSARIKHTIRLSQHAGAGEPPAAAASAAAAKSEAGRGDTTPGPDGEAAPAPAEDAENGAAGPPPAAVEVPSQQPAAPIVPKEPVLMGVNCGKRSLRAMLWGSIPEGSFDEEDENPKAESSPKGLLHPHHSIREEDESEPDEEPYREALEASENADESFEFLNDKRPPGGVEEGSQVEPVHGVQESQVAKVTVREFDTAPTAFKTAHLPVDGDERGSEPLDADVSQFYSPVQKPAAIGQNAAEKPRKDSASATRPEDGVPPVSDQPAHHEKRHLMRQDKLTSPASPPADDGDDGLGVLVGVPVHDTHQEADEPGRPDGAAPEQDSGAADPNGTPAASSPQHALHLQLTPILRSLESEKPVAEQAERAARPAPGEERRGTAPPNTPAVTEERDVVSPAPEESVSVPKVVSYYESISPAKRPSSPEEASRHSPARARSAEPREPETTAVPRVVNFAVPMQPQKVYLSSQEPDEMENTPIPRQTEPGSEPRKPAAPAGRDPAMEPQPCQSESASKGPAPANAEPEPRPQKLSAPATVPPRQEREPKMTVLIAPQAMKPAAPINKIFGPAKTEHDPQQKPGTTSELSAEPLSEPQKAPATGAISTLLEPEPTPKPAAQEPRRVGTVPEPRQLGPAALQQLVAVRESPDNPAPPPRPAEDATEPLPPPPPPPPRVYDPTLFEPEPKTTLEVASEALPSEPSPPYEPGVHDSRTLPMDSRPGGVITAQPGLLEDERTDPRDPFLPDNPIPGTGPKQDGWIGTCLDLCCCCWAP